MAFLDYYYMVNIIWYYDDDIFDNGSEYDFHHDATKGLLPYVITYINILCFDFVVSMDKTTIK